MFPPEKNDSETVLDKTDLSHVSETVRMLQLASGQIEWAMKDSDGSVQVLTDAFAAIVECMGGVSNAVARMPDDGEVGGVKSDLQGITGQVAGMINDVIVAFQFYDKLVQRLGHVNHGLSELSALVSDAARLHRPDQWQDLQQMILAKYSTKEEKAMFEAVMQGVPVKDALDKFMAEVRDKPIDIDFF